MPDLPLEIQRICAVPDEKSGCGVFTKRINLANDKDDTPTIVCCIYTKSSNDPNLVTHDVFDLFCKKIEDSQDTVLNAVSLAKEAVSGYISSQKADVSLTAALFIRDACYIAKIGDDVKVLVFNPGMRGEIKFDLGSGKVLARQIYLLATRGFLDAFEVDDLAKEQEIDLAEIIDGLATEISALDNQSKIAAGFVKVGEVPQVSEVDTEQTGEKTTSNAILGIRHQPETPESNKSDYGQAPNLSNYNQPTIDNKQSFSANKQSFSANSRLGEAAGSRGFKGLILVAASNGAKKVWHELSFLMRGDRGAIGRFRTKIVIVAVLIVLVLVGSVGFALYQKAQKDKDSKIQTYLSDASSKYSEGSSIIALNKNRARDILVQAQDDVKQALALDGKNEKVLSLSSQIEAKLKETEVKGNLNLATFVDESIPIGSLVQLDKSNILTVGVDKLFKVNTSTKSSTEVKAVSGILRGTAYDNKGFVLTSDKVARIDLAGGKPVEAGSSHGAHDIAVFVGNVYLLLDSQITKVVPIEGGYSAGGDYLNNKENFGSSSYFAIDGSVWVTSGKKIYKFTRGAKQDFAISGLPSAGDLGIIYTNANIDNLYVIDTTNSALLVIGKDGTYKKAYQASEFGQVGGLVVDDSESKVYVASGSKILAAPL